MKYNYPRGYLDLKEFLKNSGVPGRWKLRRDGKHRQFLADSGEILNYRDDSKSVWFQGREHGPLHKWFTSARAAKLAAPRKSETARVVSQLLTEALQRAEKAMTLPQLSLALAAISTEIVSGRRKPDLRGRIEQILLDVSEDEFHDERLDEHDSYYSDE
jgi:hypothetical protein